MLQSIHDKSKGFFTYLIVGLLIIVFVMWGISYYLKGFMGPSVNAAEVNKQPIPMLDFNRAYQSARSQQSGALGTAAIEALKAKVLNALMLLSLLSSSAENLGFGLSDATVSSWIANDSTFQEQGKFSSQRYQLLLQQLGISSQMLRDQIRTGVLISQIQDGISQSTFLLPNEENSYAALTHQHRETAIVFIPLDFFKANKAKTLPSEEEIKAYYDAHLSDFYAPNQVKIAYLDLKTTTAFSPNLNQLANLTFENPDSLGEASQQLNIPIQESEYFSKSGGNTALTQNPKVLEAAFSPEVMNGNNSEVINLSPNEAVVLRLLSQQKPHPKSLEESRSEILNILENQQAKILAKQSMDKLLQTSNPESMASEMGFKYVPSARYEQNSKKLSPNILQALFQAKSTDSRVIVPYQEGDKDRVLLILSQAGLKDDKDDKDNTDSKDQNPLPSEIYQTQIRYSGLWAIWEYKAYQDALIHHANIKKQL
jgi:peptidyl-prolyl cis-trans isomerase D